jgi:diguanylate cyclase (GGDEF)-like protein
MHIHKRFPFVTLFALATYLILLLHTAIFTLNASKSVESLKYDSISTGLQKAETLYSAIADIFYEEIKNDQQILEWLHLADKAPTSTRQKIRSSLHDKLTPLYSRMKKLGVKLFQFHLPPQGVSLIRFHCPGKWGDTLDSARPIMAHTLTSREISRGFEQGRIFSGYRNVYPLIHKGKLVGTVEIGFGMNTMIQSIVFKDALALAVIENTKSLKKKLFANYYRNYRPSPFSDEYWQSLSQPAIFTVPHSHVQLIREIDQNLRHKNLSYKLAAGRPFIAHSLIDYTLYDVYFYPIRDWSRNSQGYIVVYTKPSEALRIIGSALLAFILYTLLLFFFFRYAKRKEHEIYRLIDTDPLTGVLNRRWGVIQARRYMEIAKRSGGAISALFLDIDHFKTINDNFGHAAGDLVLAKLAQLLGSCLRKTDLIYRHGGEEFVIILPATNLAGSGQIAEKLRRHCEKEVFEIPTRITISLGVAERQEDEELEEWLERADKAMYEAKKAGRNCVKCD